MNERVAVAVVYAILVIALIAAERYLKSLSSGAIIHDPSGGKSIIDWTVEELPMPESLRRKIVKKETPC